MNSKKDLQKVCNLPLVDESLPALHVASKLGYDNMAKILLDICDPNTLDKEGQTALHHAASRGHIETARLLSSAKGAKVDMPSKSQCTPLWLATSNGHEEILLLLTEKQASLEAKDLNDAKDRTPLSWAAENGDAAVVKLLLEHGADVESKDNRGSTPLLWAAKNGHAAVVKLLLEHGADLESKNNFGQTPLSWAAESGDAAVVELLLEHGADLKLKDDSGRTLD
ncbi:hypothetical protein VTN00DRAFT_65 [Thermoascus crustaceus]|uniref:uncharacterized protein n=1 Tax=Thermoascus crustaceus TaxID=5088 RepID=UPI0037435CFC